MNRNNTRPSGSFPVLRRTSTPATRSGDDDSPLFATVLKNSIYGLISFVISGLILVSVMAGIAYSNPDPDIFIAPLSLVALLPSMFIGGFVTTKKTGEAPLFCGVICGAIVTVITILISLILRNAMSSGYSLFQSALLHAFAIIFCLLGSFAGNIKKRAKPGARRFGN